MLHWAYYTHRGNILFFIIIIFEESTILPHLLYVIHPLEDLFKNTWQARNIL